MDQELKQKWINALRSGKYQQAREVLRAYDGEGEVVGYCCLGVLLEVTGHEPGEDVDGTKTAGMGFSCKTWADGEELSNSALEALQLSRLETNLATRKNDGSATEQPQTFEQIADWLETVL